MNWRLRPEIVNVNAALMKHMESSSGQGVKGGYMWKRYLLVSGGQSVEFARKRDAFLLRAALACTPPSEHPFLMARASEGWRVVSPSARGVIFGPRRPWVVPGLLCLLCLFVATDRINRHTDRHKLATN